MHDHFFPSVLNLMVELLAYLRKSQIFTVRMHQVKILHICILPYVEVNYKGYFIKQLTTK